MREARAFSKDIRRGLAAEQQKTYRGKLAEIDATATRQKSECRQEHQQIKAGLTQQVYAERLRAEKAAREQKAAKKAEKIARAELVAKTAQKARECKAEAGKLRDEKATAKKDRAEIRTLERQTKAREKAKPKATRAEKVSEKRDAVEADLPPHLVALWRSEGKRFRAPAAVKAGRMSMAEAFEHYAAENPSAGVEAQEHEADAYVQQLEREQREQQREHDRTAARAPRGKGPRTAKTAAPVGADAWAKRFAAGSAVPF